MAKIDIIVPCYNYGRFLSDCVTSILEQPVQDLRVLIIDDASQDDTNAVARSLVDIDPRVFLISHSQNQGAINTYNEGISWASADYMMILSADDRLTPTALGRAVTILDGNPDVVLVHGDIIRWGEWENHHPIINYKNDYDYAWSRQEGIDLIYDFCQYAFCLVNTPTVITRTSVQKLVGGYRRQSLYHTADLEMWLRVAAHGAVAHIHVAQAIYRIHEFNMSGPYIAEKWRDCQERKLAFDSFFAEYADRLPDSQKLQALANRSLAERAFWTGLAQLCRGKSEDGRWLLRFAIDHRPRLRYCPPIIHLTRMPGLYNHLRDVLSDSLKSLTAYTSTKKG